MIRVTEEKKTYYRYQVQCEKCRCKLGEGILTDKDKLDGDTKRELEMSAKASDWFISAVGSQTLCDKCKKELLEEFFTKQTPLLKEELLKGAWKDPSLERDRKVRLDAEINADVKCPNPGEFDDIPF